MHYTADAYEAGRRFAEAMKERWIEDGHAAGECPHEDDELEAMIERAGARHDDAEAFADGAWDALSR